jgi:hypothetical protein
MIITSTRRTEPLQCSKETSAVAKAVTVKDADFLTDIATFDDVRNTV